MTSHHWDETWILFRECYCCCLLCLGLGAPDCARLRLCSPHCNTLNSEYYTNSSIFTRFGFELAQKLCYFEKIDEWPRVSIQVDYNLNEANQDLPYAGWSELEYHDYEGWRIIYRGGESGWHWDFVARKRNQEFQDLCLKLGISRFVLMIRVGCSLGKWRRPLDR